VRRGHLRTAACLVAAAVASGGVACGSDDSESDKPSNKPESASSGIVGDNDQKKPAAIGETITIVTVETTLKVTVLGVVDPVKLGGADGAERGKRFAGVRAAIQNVGSKRYTGAPIGEAVLTDSDGGEHQGGLLSESECGGSFASDPQIAPGTRKEGCIPYEIDKGADPQTFEYAGKDGFVPATAEWDLTQ